MISRIYILLICVSTLWALPAAACVNMAKTGDVSIAVQQEKNAHLINARVYREGNDLVVSGMVRNYYLNGMGQVKVSLVTLDGTTMQNTSATYYTSRMDKPYSESSFVARFNTTAPSGMKVILKM